MIPGVTPIGTGPIAVWPSGFDTASAIYSLRRLRAAYAGSAIQVRRSSDNTTQDIGFDGSGNLDTASLLTFCGSGSGFVSIWYDQSGNARHATQTTVGNQPRIVNAGSVETLGGKPAVRGIPASNTYLQVAGYTGVTIGAAVTVVNFLTAAAGTFRAAYGFRQTTGIVTAGTVPICGLGTSNPVNRISGSGGFTGGSDTAAWLFGSPVSSLTNWNDWPTGVDVTPGNPLIATQNFAVGAGTLSGTLLCDPIASSRALDGLLAEFILLPASLTAYERQTIEQSAITYYGISTSGSAPMSVTLSGNAATTFGLRAGAAFGVAMSGMANVTAGLRAAASFSTTLSGQSTVSPGLRAAASFSALLAGQAALAPGLAAGASFAVSLPGAASLTGTLTTAALLAVTMGGTATLSATLTQPAPLAVTMAGQASLTAAGTSGLAIAVTMSGRASLTPALSAGASFALSLPGIATLSATLVNNGALGVTLAGISTLTASLTQAAPLSVAMTGNASLAAGFTQAAPIAVTFAGRASFAPSLTQPTPLAAMLMGQAQLTCALSQPAPLGATLRGNASIIATLSSVGLNDGIPRSQVYLLAPEQVDFILTREIVDHVLTDEDVDFILPLGNSDLMQF